MGKNFRSQKLRAGEWVRVKSKDEILRTLDAQGCLEKLPFMPEMFKECGRTFRVFKRAHKTCDTVNKTGGRKMPDAVHLEGSRCDGAAHGGCQALCLIFWKDAWLERVNGPDAHENGPNFQPEGGGNVAHRDGGCTEEVVVAEVKESSLNSEGAPVYKCQATKLPEATTLLSRWAFAQYWEDYTSGNRSGKEIISGGIFAVYERLINLGIGWGDLLRRAYDWFQGMTGGVPYPRRRGRIPRSSKTPSVSLGLQPGEFVRVKNYDAILQTLDQDNRNRGLYFDCEEVPFCEQTFRVISRVERIINEKTGVMMEFNNPSVILDGAYCQARYSCMRMHCPRAIYPMWREIWLERVSPPQDANEIAENSVLVREDRTLTRQEQ